MKSFCNKNPRTYIVVVGFCFFLFSRVTTTPIAPLQSFVVTQFLDT